MVIRMKNFNILRVHWKIRLLEEGWGSRKTNIEGAISKKVGGLGQLVDLRGGGGGWGGLGKKEGMVSLGGGRGVDTPMHIMFRFLKILFQFKNLLIKSWFDVQTTQMSMFIWGCFFPVSIFKWIITRHCESKNRKNQKFKWDI